VPGLEEGERTALRDKAISTLETLAQDQLPRVRAVIAEAIKSSDVVPKHIVDKLARDIEAIVCGPILQYSPLLNDDDLREIIAAGATGTALEAIAKRPIVSEEVANDIAASLEIPAIAALLTNECSQIREDTLDQIIAQAENVEELHKPVALRPHLSIRAMKRVAGFVASALVHAMMDQAGLEEAQAEDILVNPSETELVIGKFWSEKKILVWKPLAIGDKLKFNIVKPEKGLYNLGITAAHMPEGGAFNVHLNGESVEFNENDTINTRDSSRVYLRNYISAPIQFDSGDNEITLEYTGKETGQEISIDFFWFKDK